MDKTSYSSKREQNLLLELYEARKDILGDKKTEFSMRGKLKKAEAWESIAREYNAAGLGPQKNITQLKRMWQHMKGRAKKEYAEEKKEAMRTGGGLPKPEEGNASMTTVRILSTISKELESGGNVWDSDALDCASNSAIEESQLADESILLVDPGTTDELPLANPSTSQSRTHTPASSIPEEITTPYTRKRKYARATLTAQEASMQEFISFKQKEHEMDMKLKEMDLQIKQSQLRLAHKDEKIKDVDLKLKEMELKIKEKEYLIKEKYLENLNTT